MAAAVWPRTADMAHAGPWGRFHVGFGAWSPAVDLINRDSEVVVRVDLPGLDREDVLLAVEPEMLHLRGARAMDATAPGDAYHCLERWSGPFTRAIRLPAEVQTGQMTATVTHGVLEVRLPKRHHATRQPVNIHRQEATPSPGAGRRAGDAGTDSPSRKATHTA